MDENYLKCLSVELKLNFSSNFSQIVTLDEVAAATASIAQPPDEETENLVDSVTLEHCAEQILSGVKKDVEVQYLLPMSVPRNEQNSTNNHQNESANHRSSSKDTGNYYIFDDQKIHYFLILPPFQLIQNFFEVATICKTDSLRLLA